MSASGELQQLDFPTAEEISIIARDESRSFAEEADVIAREYRRLALAMAERVGRDDLNWCGFAMWSSRAIGMSLRLDRRSSFWTKARTAFRVHWLFAGVFRRVLRTLLGSAYSKGLSIANRSIFLEIGTFYTDLLTPSRRVSICQNGALRDQSFAHPLLSELTRQQKENLLRAAQLFRDAERATGETRSHLVLAANIALSAHEQARVQRVLEYVLYRPVRWITRVSWRTPLYWLIRRPLPRFDIYTETHGEQPPLTRWLEGAWSRGYVRALSLDIPEGQVVVGRPLERPASPPNPASPLLDAEFRDPTATLVTTFQPDPASRFNGVRDWLDYDDRMRFIVSYFMTYQNDPRMFRDPFRGRPPARPTIVAACTQWMSRTLPLPKVVDPAIDELNRLVVEPETVDLGELSPE